MNLDSATIHKTGRVSNGVPVLCEKQYFFGFDIIIIRHILVIIGNYQINDEDYFCDFELQTASK